MEATEIVGVVLLLLGMLGVGWVLGWRAAMNFVMTVAEPIMNMAGQGMKMFKGAVPKGPSGIMGLIQTAISARPDLLDSLIPKGKQ